MVEVTVEEEAAPDRVVDEVAAATAAEAMDAAEGGRAAG